MAVVRHFAPVIVGLTGLFGSAHAQEPLPDVIIGLVAPMTGSYAPFGRQMAIGFDAAVAEANAAGGVLGRTLRTEVADDACDRDLAVRHAELMAGRKAHVVIGHFCSGASIAAAAVYSRASIVQITPASRHPKLTDERAGPNVFRLAGRDDRQGEVAGRFLADRFKGKTVAILHDRTRYGRGLADDTKRHMNDAGLQEALYEGYIAGAKDYRPLVAKLKAARVDLVYIGGFHTEAGLIARQMREQGLDARIMSGDALATADDRDAVGPAGDGTLMTFLPDARKTPAAAAVIARLNAKGIEPDGIALHTYAAVQTWLEAVRAAGTDEPARVMEQLGTREFTTVLGAIRFNKKGDALLAPYEIYEWRRGRYQQIDETPRPTPTIPGSPLQ